MPTAPSPALLAPPHPSRVYASANNFGALREYAAHPERYYAPDGSGMVLGYDARTVVLRDGYPKAQVHLLVVPRPSGWAAALAGVERPRQLRTITQAGIVTTLGALGEAQGRRVLAAWAGAHPGARVPALRLGFHASPSLEPLHLHVISDDMHSACLTTRRHYASFTTAFFLPLAGVVEGLRDFGDSGVFTAADEAAAEAALKHEGGELACHRCGRKATSVPDLKGHLPACAGMPGVPPAVSAVSAAVAAAAGRGR
jgi:aprataxin